MRIDPTGVVSLAAAAVAVAGLSVTISRSGIMAPVRAWVTRRNAWLGDLLGCGYCVSHWLALGVVAIARPDLAFGLPAPADFVLQVFFIVATSSIVAGTIVRLTFGPAKPLAEAGQPPPGTG